MCRKHVYRKGEYMRKKCSVDGCDEFVVGRGLCNKHYYRLKRTGKLETKRDVESFVYKSEIDKCTFDGCNNKVKAAGLCSNHYKQKLKYGKPGSTLGKTGGECSIEGCDKPVHSKGMCLVHYQKQRKYGNPLEVRQQESSEFCTDCGKKIKSSSLGRCRKCYYKYKVSTDEEYAHKMNQRNHRRRTAILGVKSEKYTKTDVFEKTNGVCHICGEVIDMTIKSPNKRSFSIDHVIPVSLGGDDILENVMPAHRGCNSSKSNKIIGE